MFTQFESRFEMKTQTPVFTPFGLRLKVKANTPVSTPFGSRFKTKLQRSHNLGPVSKWKPTLQRPHNHHTNRNASSGKHNGFTDETKHYRGHKCTLSNADLADMRHVAFLSMYAGSHTCSVLGMRPGQKWLYNAICNLLVSRTLWNILCRIKPRMVFALRRHRASYC